MSGFFYLTALTILFIFSIVRDINLFNRGLYNPFPFRKGIKELPNLVKLGINSCVLIGAYVTIPNIRLATIMTYIFLLYSFCLVVYTSVLNYLSYIKIKDPKIIIQTAIFNVMIIVVSTSIWKFVIK